MIEEVKERLQLSLERIAEIKKDKLLEPALQDYAETVAGFILLVEEQRQWVLKGEMKKASLEQLQKRNTQLYQDVLPSHYENSYANPKTAVKKLGEKGKILSALYAEIRSIISDVVKEEPKMMLIRLELFLEIYGLLVEGAEEESLREAYYWFAYDYAQDIIEAGVKDQFVREESFGKRIVIKEACEDLRYLYYYQEYISEDQLRLANFMYHLPKEKIKLMADTYTEGFRKGFEVTGKDLSRKKRVNIYFTLGMEPMILEAIKNFEAIGLKACIFPASSSFIASRSLQKPGYYGANANKQFEYDHENDKALYINGKYINRKLEAYEAVLETYKQEISYMAGPAVVEEFGEEPFIPTPKEENLQLTEKQRTLLVEYGSKAKKMLNQYAKEEEISFTIIAFPTPAIGDKFEEIFEDTIGLNTLDGKVYETYQQIIIDALDLADYVRIKGKGANETDIQVALWPLENPDVQTNFENCVADVNIPVGEVFTSPRLKGTKGLLHVPKVFLKGLEYHDLKLTFQDGMITEYSCKNFENEEENKKLIREKLLGNRETLPLGEFAIGTNTTAYQVARKYKIEALLPILIAEKTGPHFAIGDTCYCMEEEVVSYNPNGKQIMAKENECSKLRHSNPQEAYFQCHTDITIPYDELAQVTAVGKKREETIIREGRFVLKGLEELNKPFD